MIILTKHAEKRMRERLGIGRHSCQRIAERAWVEGKKSHELAGRLRRYVSALTFKKEQLANIRVYGFFVYVFENNGGTLITVHDIDVKIRKSAEGQVGKND